MTDSTYTGFALVSNINSNSDYLTFDKFRLSKISQGWLGDFEKAKMLFGEGIAYYGDWVLEKNYPNIPPVYDNETRYKISRDIEDTLLLLRLFRSGDIIFKHIHIRQPDGTLLKQFPYRIYADIVSVNSFHFNENDCPQSLGVRFPEACFACLEPLLSLV